MKLSPKTLKTDVVNNLTVVWRPSPRSPCEYPQIPHVPYISRNCSYRPKFLP